MKSIIHNNSSNVNKCKPTTIVVARFIHAPYEGAGFIEHLTIVYSDKSDDYKGVER
jgi:hypothetical protein